MARHVATGCGNARLDLVPVSALNVVLAGLSVSGETWRVVSCQGSARSVSARRGSCGQGSARLGVNWLGSGNGTKYCHCWICNVRHGEAWRVRLVTGLVQALFLNAGNV